MQYASTTDQSLELIRFKMAATAKLSKHKNGCDVKMTETELKLLCGSCESS